MQFLDRCLSMARFLRAVTAQRINHEIPHLARRIMKWAQCRAAVRQPEDFQSNAIDTGAGKKRDETRPSN